MVVGFIAGKTDFNCLYSVIASDGDSTAVPYLTSTCEWTIKRIPCMNHFHKCSRTRLEKWLKLKHVVDNGWATLMRKDSRHLKLILSLKAACRSALSTQDKAKAAKNLEHDLTNSVMHAIGFHEKCRTTFCRAAQLLRPEEPVEAAPNFLDAQTGKTSSIKDLLEKNWDDRYLFADEDEPITPP